LGYTPNSAILQKVGIKSLYIFSTVQNILTFTKYSGLDPEVNAYGVNSRGTEIGIDYGTYPQSKTYIFGVNITF
jgi:TonB-dependent starch-binding outer membrane protein SusC